LTFFNFKINFYFLLDIYTYFGLKSLFQGTGLRIYQVVYFLTSLFVYYSFYKIYQTIQAGNFFRDASYNFYLGIVVTAIVSKLVFIVILFLQDSGRRQVLRVFHWRRCCMGLPKGNINTRLIK